MTGETGYRRGHDSRGNGGDYAQSSTYAYKLLKQQAITCKWFTRFVTHQPTTLQTKASKNLIDDSKTAVCMRQCVPTQHFIRHQTECCFEQTTSFIRQESSGKGEGKRYTPRCEESAAPQYTVAIQRMLAFEAGRQSALQRINVSLA